MVCSSQCCLCVASLFVFSLLLSSGLWKWLSEWRKVCCSQQMCVSLRLHRGSVWERYVMRATRWLSLSISLTLLTSRRLPALYIHYCCWGVFFKAARAGFVKKKKNVTPCWMVVIFCVTEDSSCLVMPPAPGMWFIVEHLHVKPELRNDHYFPHLLWNDALGNVMSL